MARPTSRSTYLQNAATSWLRLDICPLSCGSPPNASLVQGLAVEAPKLLAPYVAFLRDEFLAAKKAPQKSSMILAKSILPMFTAWAKVMEIDAIAHLRLPQMMAAFFRYPHLRTHAFNCLNALSARKKVGGGSADVDFDLVVIRMFEIAVDVMRGENAVLSTGPSGSSMSDELEELYVAQKVAARWVETLGVTHLERIAEKAEKGRLDGAEAAKVCRSSSWMLALHLTCVSFSITTHLAYLHDFS